MMPGDMFGAQSFGQLEGDLFDQAARVDEDQRAAMLLRDGG